MRTISLFVMKAPSILSACFLALWAGDATIVRAQEYQAGAYFTTVVPRGEFKENVSNNGYGGGVQIPLSQKGERAILLDGNVRYLRGSQAEYLKKGSIRQENGQAFFDVLSSRTDVIAVQIGVTFRF